ncbi:zinc finger MYM-type protein 1-like [Aphis craccivora]|uniref:Zinc finger MYM-type protein 1-like n=1 Tax=Aphis craccivora TaxID=307492 RepID=A0A6G0VRP4_APHCR|nr:zinc finger MYM-type protein 1-like [Aphis craccivora]
MFDINSRFTSGKRYEVERNKAVLERLIDIIKLIGKRGLSYRGAKDEEAAYTLNDPSLDHGNFLEMVMLLSKYDPVLKEHTDRAIYKSQKSKNRQTVSRPGRPGGLVTFLSKTIVDYIIEIIGSLMKTTIAENIRKAPFFTIQIDSTQDINVHDQLAINIRFVTDDINEKLLAIVDCKSGKGKNLCDIVCKALNNLNLDVKNCIGSSTDGAVQVICGVNTMVK